nr:uncharacterized protein LOC109180246 [Ipomoea batatas]
MLPSELAIRARRPPLRKGKAQLFQVDLNNDIQSLAKDSELLKSAKAAHSKEVKTLKVDLTKMGDNLAMAQEGWAKATEALKAEDVALNALVDTLGGEIPMDNAYLESTTNVDSIARMNRASVPTLIEVGRSDVAAIGEEEDPSNALQLNRQRSRSSERNLLTGPSDASVSGVPQSEA